jgi:methionyl-tRNA formyltransferase
MNVVFMGTPEFACPALEALAKSHHNLLAVVTGRDMPAGRGRKIRRCEVKLRALSLNVPIFQPEKLRDDSFIEEISSFQADLYIVIAFRILPKKLYTIPKKGSINIHASLLPKYRGAAPINHALLNGESETGLTSFFLTPQVDQGDVISQIKTSIDENENFTSLYSRLSEMAGPFLLETLELTSGPGFKATRQDSQKATPAPKIKIEDCLIDWNQSKWHIHNHIRAFSEKPGAYTYLDNRRVKIIFSDRGDFEGLPHLEPGEIYIDRKRLYVGTNDYPLEITGIMPEGKKLMNAPSFINGYRINSSQKFLATRKEVIN